MSEARQVQFDILVTYPHPDGYRVHVGQTEAGEVAILDDRDGVLRVTTPPTDLEGALKLAENVLIGNPRTVTWGPLGRVLSAVVLTFFAHARRQAAPAAGEGPPADGALPAANHAPPAAPAPVPREGAPAGPIPQGQGFLQLGSQPAAAGQARPLVLDEV